MQWILWACEPPEEFDVNTGSGHTPLYAVVSGPCGPVSFLQIGFRILSQARQHTMQWILWACEPPAECDMNTGTGQKPHYAVVLVSLWALFKMQLKYKG